MKLYLTASFHYNFLEADGVSGQHFRPPLPPGPRPQMPPQQQQAFQQQQQQQLLQQQQQQQMENKTQMLLQQRPQMPGAVQNPPGQVIQSHIYLLDFKSC